MSEDAYGRRVVAVETANAARRLRDGNLESVWRALPDGSVQVARPRWGRVELYTVSPGAPPELTESSARSKRKTVAEVLFVGSAAALVVGVVGAMFVSTGFLMLAGLTFVTFPLALLLRWRSHVRPWVRAHFGADDDWAIVPWRINGEPATGNQAIAMSALVSANGNRGRYRNAADGAVELLTRRGTAFRIDRLGNVSEAAGADWPWLSDRELEAQDEWHEILTYDPTD